jgi:hypothetical protein
MSSRPIPALQTPDSVPLLQTATFVPSIDGPAGFGVERCVAVPSAHAAAWAEILAEARSGTITPGVLDAALNVREPFVLLTPEAAQRWTGSNRGFQAATVFRFSVVYFNTERTLALAYVVGSCGSLCGHGRWAPVERQTDGRWIERTGWVHCSVVG